MEVERFKHRQLAPTVGQIVEIISEFEGLYHQINLLKRCGG
jgi:hypothetical protein